MSSEPESIEGTADDIGINMSQYSRFSDSVAIGQEAAARFEARKNYRYWGVLAGLVLWLMSIAAPLIAASLLGVQPPLSLMIVPAVVGGALYLTGFVTKRLNGREGLTAEKVFTFYLSEAIKSYHEEEFTEVKEQLKGIKKTLQQHRHHLPTDAAALIVRYCKAIQAIDNPEKDIEKSFPLIAQEGVDCIVPSQETIRITSVIADLEEKSNSADAPTAAQQALEDVGSFIQIIAFSYWGAIVLAFLVGGAVFRLSNRPGWSIGSAALVLTIYGIVRDS